MIFLSNLVNGLSLGSIYAIIALGYTMVYGIAKMLNFAHGDVIMVGAYIAFCALQYWGLPPVGALLAASYPTGKHLLKYYYPIRFRKLTKMSAGEIIHLINRGIEGFARGEVYKDQ